MTQATFTISGSEFNDSVIEKIKSLLNGSEQNYEIFIRVKAKESNDEMRKRIEESASELERMENTVHFTPSEYEAFINNFPKR